MARRSATAAAAAAWAARRAGVGGRARAGGTAADTEGVVGMGTEAAEVEAGGVVAWLKGFLGWRR